MLPKLSRYLIIIVVVFALSNALPNIYDTLFDVRVDPPFVTYSVIKNDFIISRSEGGVLVYSDTKGNYLDRRKVDELQPFLFYTQLTNDGRMPDTLLGEKTDLSAISKEFFYNNIESSNYSKPDYGLYILFESQSGRVGVEYPEDFFRLGNGIEFINCRTNKIDKEKSEKYTNAMLKAGFVFPAGLVAGIPFDFKSHDDGNFITDKNGKLYHLKMVKGEPYFVKIATEDSFSIKHIECVDNRNYTEFMAYIITDDNKIHILKTKDYDITQLPIDEYIPEEQRLTIIGDYKTRHTALVGPGYIKAYAIDKNYNLIDRYSEEWQVKDDMTEGKLTKILFPFILKLKAGNSEFLKFALSGFKGYGWLIVNLVLLLGYVYIIIRNKRVVYKNMLDLFIIGLSGIFGFIAVNVFPNKEY
jgi:hypothetical protein